MYPGYYHVGYNPLTRYRGSVPSYDVEYMCEGPWSYIMDDFGGIKAISEQTLFSCEVKMV